VPLAGVTVSHVALLTAVQPQPEPDVTLTLSVPFAADEDSARVIGDTA